MFYGFIYSLCRDIGNLCCQPEPKLKSALMSRKFTVQPVREYRPVISWRGFRWHFRRPRRVRQSSYLFARRTV
jgi:hypothetical protein